MTWRGWGSVDVRNHWPEQWKGQDAPIATQTTGRVCLNQRCFWGTWEQIGVQEEPEPPFPQMLRESQKKNWLGARGCCSPAKSPDWGGGSKGQARAAELIVRAWWPAEISQLSAQSLLGQCQPQSTSHALVPAVDILFSPNYRHSDRIQFLGMSRLFPLRTHTLLWGKARRIL
jgi:hypothetical protein